MRERLSSLTLIDEELTIFAMEHSWQSIHDEIDIKTSFKQQNINNICITLEANQSDLSFDLLLDDVRSFLCDSY